MRRASGWLWLGLAIVLFAGSFALTYARLLPAKEWLGQAAPGLDERLSAGASLTLRYILADGQRGSEERLWLPDDLIGATVSDLRRQRPSWSIVRFTPEELVAEVRCAPSSGGGFLGEKEGRVAVFEGEPGACGILRQITDIPVDSIRPEERQRLQLGIPFRDGDERQQLLDGLLGD